jgi:hypothetical protein
VLTVTSRGAAWSRPGAADAGDKPAGQPVDGVLGEPDQFGVGTVQAELGACRAEGCHDLHGPGGAQVVQIVEGGVTDLGALNRVASAEVRAVSFMPLMAFDRT